MSCLYALVALIYNSIHTIPELGSYRFGGLKFAATYSKYVTAN
jgi:hypothetical protein